MEAKEVGRQSMGTFYLEERDARGQWGRGKDNNRRYWTRQEALVAGRLLYGCEPSN
ncbi:MAG: hypothetical protein OXN44_08605 [Acidimicrobiaceae bacterium]|nr:hypothetical protein [Acidimicrobiaceae bacterium]